MYFRWLYILAMVGIAAHASAGTPLEDFLKIVNDMDYQCDWKGKPLVGEVKGDKVCVGSISCTLLPRLANSETAERKKDERFETACKAKADGTCPGYRECGLEPSTELPRVTMRPAELLESSKGKASDEELGTCEYDTINNLPRGVGIERKDSSSLFCFTPIKCFGGRTPPKQPWAVCRRSDVKVVKELNKETEKMEEVYYPVCADPIACLKKADKENLKFDFATVSKKDAKNSVGNVAPHARKLGAPQFVGIELGASLRDLPHL